MAYGWTSETFHVPVWQPGEHTHYTAPSQPLPAAESLSYNVQSEISNPLVSPLVPSFAQSVKATELTFGKIDEAHPEWAACGRQLGAFKVFVLLNCGREVHWVLRITPGGENDLTIYKARFMAPALRRDCSFRSTRIRYPRKSFPDPGHMTSAGWTEFFHLCEIQGLCGTAAELPWTSYKDLLKLAFSSCPYIEGGQTYYPREPEHATSPKIFYT